MGFLFLLDVGGSLLLLVISLLHGFFFSLVFLLSLDIVQCGWVLLGFFWLLLSFWLLVLYFSLSLVFLCLWVSVSGTLCILVGFLLVVGYFWSCLSVFCFCFCFFTCLVILFGLLEIWLGSLFVFGCWCFFVVFWGRILFMILFCFLFFLRFCEFLLFCSWFLLATVGCFLFVFIGDLLMFFLLPFSFFGASVFETFSEVPFMTWYLWPYHFLKFFYVFLVLKKSRNMYKLSMFLDKNSKKAKWMMVDCRIGPCHSGSPRSLALECQ